MSSAAPMFPTIAQLRTAVRFGLTISVITFVAVELVAAIAPGLRAG